MKIGLVSSVNIDNDIEFNLNQIENYAKEAHDKDVDMICFAESFLQGFEGLTWDYAKDKNIALSLNSREINKIRQIASDNNVSISTGFIQNNNDCLYSSNIVISKNGEIVDVFKRVSKGWKEPIATKEYMEGLEFHIFNYMNKSFSIALCGDLWDDERLKEMEGINCDLVLWPVYLDYSVEVWNDEVLLEYADRVKNIKSPVLMINSFVNEAERANGGCYVFHNNKIISDLPIGNIGMLIYEFK